MEHAKNLKGGDASCYEAFRNSCKTWQIRETEAQQSSGPTGSSKLRLMHCTSVSCLAIKECKRRHHYLHSLMDMGFLLGTILDYTQLQEGPLCPLFTAP